MSWAATGMHNKKHPLIAIDGPAGSGKSTVLHLIAGLTPPDAGRVFVEDVDISALDSVAARFSARSMRSSRRSRLR